MEVEKRLMKTEVLFSEAWAEWGEPTEDYETPRDQQEQDAGRGETGFVNMSAEGTEASLQVL